MEKHYKINFEHKFKKRTWRIDRPPIPGSEKLVREYVNGLSYKGLNAELRKLGYKTALWNQR